MLYQRSLDIERRLQDVLDLIKTGRYSTPELAERLHVSIPTISRDVTALRQRGHDIRSGREDGEWRYVLADATRRARRRPKTSGNQRRRPR